MRKMSPHDPPVADFETFAAASVEDRPPDTSKFENAVHASAITGRHADTDDNRVAVVI
ncbi:MAG: hypothetical protein IPJ68_00905 [Candidatus Moraniibacteriota bacterium]|nr:MAG: hypothetical protein IPJ68_00905 [Candidatus Moranbacteria bacterium]